MQQFSSLLSWRLFTAQHVLGVFPPIIRRWLWFYLGIVVTIALCSWSGRPARPRTQHDYHHDTKVRSEAVTAIIELLMMGGKIPETCWAVNKRQDIKLENCCIRLVIYLNCFCMISAKFKATGQISIQIPKFHGNPSSAKRADTCRRTDGRIDMAKVMLAFRDSAKAPDNHFSQRGHHIDSVSLSFCLTHCGRVTQICVFNTVKLGTSASSP